jgi:hypothetical protein
MKSPKIRKPKHVPRPKKLDPKRAGQAQAINGLFKTTSQAFRHLLKAGSSAAS